MNPFLQQVIGAIVRATIVWLAARFGAELSEDQLVSLTAQIAPIVLVLAWSLYQKFKGRQKLLTALATNGQLTEREVEQMVKSPLTVTPSVMSPKNEVPS